MKEKYFKREKYLNKIRPFYHSDIVKVITGIRRCGKKELNKFLFIGHFNCTHFLRGVRKLYQNRYLHTDGNYPNLSGSSFLFP